MQAAQKQQHINNYPNILADRIAFLEVDDSSRAALREYLPALQQALPEFLEAFYGAVKSWPELRGMFQDESRMDYAKNAQAQHWLRLFRADFDQEYVDSVSKIGLVHSKIGLEPKWYLGAYGFVLNRMYAHAVRQYSSRFAPEKAQAKVSQLMRALNQCVMIDMDMAISIYLDENKKSYDEKLSSMAHNFESSVGAIVDSVSAAAAELQASAESLAAMSEQTSASASKVSAASEEASSNISTVSSATEEMTASISHVADMASKSSSAAEHASRESEKSEGTMRELQGTIEKINAVTELITDIAEQTNLLALNATIEAARAGDAGKGFAVVASEVKSLASETGKATEDIRAQVSEIIDKSQQTSESIMVVKGVIDESRNVSNETAESIDQQKKAITEISTSVSQTSEGTSEIARNIDQISKGASGVNDAAAGILDASRDLAKQSDVLKQEVGRFIDELKSSD